MASVSLANSTRSDDEDQSKPEEQQRGVVYDDDEENAFTGCMMMICGTILCLALPKCVEVFGTHLTKEVPAVIDVLMQYLLLWTTMLAATLFLYASVRLIRNWLYRRSGSRMRLGWRFMAKKVKLEDEGSAGEVV